MEIIPIQGSDLGGWVVGTVDRALGRFLGSRPDSAVQQSMDHRYSGFMRNGTVILN